MDKLVVNSPAKFNLGLNVIDKRSDGYHNLNTIFYPLTLSDKITFTKAKDFSFYTNNPSLLNEKNNLIVKAKNLLEKKSKIRIDCKIYLDKIIPIGAGLGGGSSNAALTLRALNILYKLGYSDLELKKLALKLGSDVPFFINPVPSFANSRGEKLCKIDLKLKGYILLVNPGIHISTKWAFESIKIKNTIMNLDEILNKLKSKVNLLKIITNDFEEVVFEKYPKIKTIKESLLNSGAYFSLMTGTGSTVYGLFDDLKKAESAIVKFSEIYFKHIENL
ncbi:MAG: 4-(cytidine 5'-diphospho)-2-C-methyl-D-erythritol kinase [Ignavibacteriales bacterium CG_4_9_14_3_um_filter_30_11]|nr:MAG: 4-(cytidine 5'-diphospho)-2-C-methyl-D-erythritol kinase [Ignavibacteriales bacterium CG_4_9_14_3_um_filter_30_11]